MPPSVAAGGPKAAKPSTHASPAPAPPPLTPTDLLAAVTKRVQGAGLLLSKEHARLAALPYTETGVSLAYLRALAAELAAPVNGNQKLIDAGTSTDAVVQRFVLPTTKGRKSRRVRHARPFNMQHHNTDSQSSDIVPFQPGCAATRW